MQQYSQNSQLLIHSTKKHSTPTTNTNDLLLVNRNNNSTLLFRGKSSDLSTLTKQSKLKQMDTLYDHYNLFKYSKVVTGDQSARVRNSVMMRMSNNDKNDLNPEIKKYKNGVEARKESTELKLRLGELKDGRKGVMNQIKKFVSIDRK